MSPINNYTTPKEVTFQLRKPFNILSFVSPQQYKEFMKFLARKKSDSNVLTSDYSGYGTILGDLIANIPNIEFVGDKFDFILNGQYYCNYLRGINESVKWLNYLTEHFECSTDVESAATAIEAMEYIGSCKFDYVIVYRSIKSFNDEEA